MTPWLSPQSSDRRSVFTAAPGTLPVKSLHVAQQHRDTMEKSAEKFQRSVRNNRRATNEAANVVKICYSTALKGMQDYNSKVVEFTQANTKSYVEFVFNGWLARSAASEFIELCNDHARTQLVTMTEQPKHLLSSLSKSPLLPPTHSRRVLQGDPCAAPSLILNLMLSATAFAMLGYATG
jgi:hypothetical protein